MIAIFLAGLKSVSTDSGGGDGWGARVLGHHRSMQIIICLGIVLLGCFVTDVVMTITGNAHQDAVRAKMTSDLASLRGTLQHEIELALFIGRSVSAFVENSPTVRPRHLGEMLSTVVDNDPQVAYVSLAPGNVISFIYPEDHGGGVPQGSLLQLPGQAEVIDYAIAHRHSVLSLPFLTSQGRNIVVCRTPVFLPNGKYWGLVNVVIDLDKVLMNLRVSAAADNIEYFLFASAMDGARSDVIDGAAAVLGQSPIKTVLSVPGGYWSLSAVPSQGWGLSTSALRKGWAEGIALSLLVASIMWLLLSNRAGTLRYNEELSTLVAQLNEANAHLADQMSRDPLTDLYNRRYFDTTCDEAWRRCHRQNQTLCLLMIDVDNFKLVNDTHGHDAGDAILRMVTRFLQATFLTEDQLVCRYGGDEFIVLLEGASVAQAVTLAESLRSKVVGPKLIEFGAMPLTIETTLSIGVAGVVPGLHRRLSDLRRASDQALYDAKRRGRNCVVGVDLDAREGVSDAV